MPGDIIILHTCTKNYDQMMCDSWDMAHNRWTDGQTDGKSDILRWVLHLKIITVPFMPCWKCNKEKIYHSTYIYARRK